MDGSIDIRNEPCVIITDTYTKGGTHLKSVCKTQGGRIIWEEGRTPAKDVWMLSHIDWPWEMGSE